MACSTFNPLTLQKYQPALKIYAHCVAEIMVKLP
ncbi:hypothetical protein BvCmsKSP050_00860 [Escherichia coli]|nr:hypothetical protein BvCmsKSP050_00860 [Escherichia coli]